MTEQLKAAKGGGKNNEGWFNLPKVPVTILGPLLVLLASCAPTALEPKTLKQPSKPAAPQTQNHNRIVTPEQSANNVERSLRQRAIAGINLLNARHAARMPNTQQPKEILPTDNSILFFPDVTATRLINAFKTTSNDDIEEEGENFARVFAARIAQKLNTKERYDTKIIVEGKYWEKSGSYIIETTKNGVKNRSNFILFFGGDANGAWLYLADMGK